jgi:hypothetical protein
MMPIFGDFCRFLSIFVDFWRFLAIFGDFWRFLAIFGDFLREICRRNRVSPQNRRFGSRHGVCKDFRSLYIPVLFVLNLICIVIVCTVEEIMLTDVPANRLDMNFDITHRLLIYNRRISLVG